jgi:phage-related protein (TIGR01555 family)
MAATNKKTKERKISFEAISLARQAEALRDPTELAERVFSLPQVMPGVVPKRKDTGVSGMAMDSSASANYAILAASATFSEGLQFMGYPYLSELAQRAEYRRAAEIYAREMTRKWIKLTAYGDEDKTDKIRAIEQEMTRLKVREKFRQAATTDGLMGRAHIFMEMAESDPDENKKPLLAKPEKIQIGSLKRLKVIEPVWTYPSDYNSNDPTNVWFYNPRSWFIMGNEVDTTRLLTMVSRPVPDLLKPAYSFGGLSLTQMMKPYVDNWIRTRQSVSDLIHSFSVTGVKTDLSDVLSGAASGYIDMRAELFNLTRDNRGLMMLNQDEDFFNVSTPLSSLDSLQQEAIEHIASVAGIPLVIYLGVTPSGLNASAEGEMQGFYNAVNSLQEAIFRDNLEHLIDIIQLSLFGEIDQSISFDFEPLWSLDEEKMAQVKKTEAETDSVYVEMGAIAPEEVRNKIAKQDDSPYSALDLDKKITPEYDPEKDDELKAILNGKAKNPEIDQR